MSNLFIMSRKCKFKDFTIFKIYLQKKKPSKLVLCKIVEFFVCCSSQLFIIKIKIKKMSVSYIGRCLRKYGSAVLLI